MPRRINLAALLLLTACSSRALMPDLVDLATIPGIVIDVRYATADNFMKRPLYPVAKAYARPQVAAALRAVQEDLAREGLHLKVWDAYRPHHVTVAMWEEIRNPDYVADPAKGSRHNRGAAVDVTLVDRQGRELEMPTGYDDFSPAAAGSNANSEKLRQVMERHGFERLPSEWWHFDYAGWERYEILDVPLKKLKS